MVVVVDRRGEWGGDSEGEGARMRKSIGPASASASASTKTRRSGGSNQILRHTSRMN